MSIFKGRAAGGVYRRSSISYENPGLKITDSWSPVMMTDQIFFSPNKPRFWPIKYEYNKFFCQEYRTTLAVDRLYYIDVHIFDS